MLENVTPISNSSKSEVTDVAFKKLSGYDVFKIKVSEGRRSLRDQASNRSFGPIACLLPEGASILTQANSAEFGVPQHRPRVYFVGFRRDALRPEIAAASASAVQGLLEMKLRRRRVDPGNFREFLGLCGAPIADKLVNPGDDSADADCTCGVHSLCELHTCRCSICRRVGAESMKCLWRRGQAKSLQSLQWKGSPGKSRDLGG